MIVAIIIAIIAAMIATMIAIIGKRSNNNNDGDDRAE